MSDLDFGTDLVLQQRVVEEARRVSVPRAVAVYLLHKRKRLTPASERGYRAVLEEFAKTYSTRTIGEFEPPLGAKLIEDFLAARWGELAARTYNKSFAIIHDFVEFQVDRGTLRRDPMRALERAKPRPVYRTTFSDEQCERILAANPDPRDQIALRLLLFFGIRKGALRGIQFEHFDFDSRKLVVFTKGEKHQIIHLHDEQIWIQLGQIDEPGHHYLLPKQTQRRRTPPNRRLLKALADTLDTAAELAATIDDQACSREAMHLRAELADAARWHELAVAAASVQVTREYDKPIGEHGMHLLWYRWLARAGVVEKGITSGERMHKARHSAAQRVVDKTGNMKAAQKLLGHASMQTTSDIYTDLDDVQLEQTMRAVLGSGS